MRLKEKVNNGKPGFSASEIGRALQALRKTRSGGKHTQFQPVIAACPKCGTPGLTATQRKLPCSKHSMGPRER